MKAPVLLVVLGQSNAVGHGIVLEKHEQIDVPLKNVFGLTWDDNTYPSQNAAVWRGFVTSGMNIGEATENFGSISNYLAPMWQAAVDSGCDLPDLYIVDISIGAQGVTKEYMWYPGRKEKFRPGKLGEVDISLTPYSENILSRVAKYFDELGVKPKIEIHWRGGENDYLVPKENLENVLLPIYREIFTRLWAALGQDADTVLHRIVCDTRALYFSPEDGRCLVSMGYVNNTFEAMAREFENVTVFDATLIPGYTLSVEERGIFLNDMVHFTPEANKWVAKQIFDRLAD
ncbi:MAG: hypothetical protein IKZ19_04730 [Clostridia bacterium]|nr:hypothetical protein [Clostridia bacterium]